MMHFSQRNRRRTLITSVLAVGIVAVTVAIITTAMAPVPAQPVPTPAAAVSTPAVRASVDGWVAATAAGIPSARSLVVNVDQLLPPGETVTAVILHSGTPASAGNLCFRADVRLTSPTETINGIETGSQSITPYDVLVSVQDPAFPVVTWARAFAGGAEATCG